MVPDNAAPKISVQVLHNIHDLVQSCVLQMQPRLFAVTQAFLVW